MSAATMIDWTQVLVLGVPAYIGAIFAGLAALKVASNARKLNTPSGHTIGEVAERSEHIGNANAASLDALHKRLNGENVLPQRAATKGG